MVKHNEQHNLTTRSLSIFKSKNAKLHAFDITCFDFIPELSIYISSLLNNKKSEEQIVKISLEIFKVSYTNKKECLANTTSIDTRAKRIYQLRSYLTHYVAIIEEIIKDLPHLLSLHECRVISSIILAARRFDLYKIFIIEMLNAHAESQPSEEQEFKILNLLNKNNLTEYQKKSTLLENYHYELLNKIKDKKVAIVGPVQPLIKSGDEIDSYDIIFRFNYINKIKNPIYFGTKTTASFYINPFLEKAISNNSINDLDFFIYQNSKPIKNPTKHQGFPRFQPCMNNQPLLTGGANAIQRALFNILMYQPKKIKIFNANLWIRNNFEETYTSEHPDTSPERYLYDFVWHDPASNFVYTQQLYNHKLFETDSELNSILSLDLPAYLDKLGNSIGL